MTLSLPNKTWLKNLIIAGSTMLLMTLFMVLFADKASAHGYVDSPGAAPFCVSRGKIPIAAQSCMSLKAWKL